MLSLRFCFYMILHKTSYDSDIDIDTNTDTDDESFKNDSQIRNVMLHQYQLVATLAIVEVANYQMHHVMKENKRTSILIGHMWFQELKIGNKNRFFEQFRMRKHVFRELASDLNQKHGLEPMKHVNIEEVVVIKELHIEIQKKDFNILGG